MKVLIIGTTGFIGGNARKILSREHDVFVANRQKGDSRSFVIDLMNPVSIRHVLDSVQPEVIISCAGVIDVADDVSRNATFTKNLLDAVVATKRSLRRIIISGSAGEYGVVDSLPVREDAPLAATSDYGVSKVREEQIASEFAQRDHLPVVVARIFNPIGVGMKERFLIPRLLKQVVDYKNHKINEIAINRLDSARDYVSVDDISHAFNAIIKGEPSYFAYNIGSGKSTTNGELLNLLLQHEQLANPSIVETSDTAEPLAASQADISRLLEDFNWRPSVSLDDTIKEIIHEQKD